MHFSKGRLKVTGKVTRIFALAIVACIASPLHSQDESVIKSEFRNPGKQFRPMVRWWWPGGDVNDEEIKREIGILDGAGFGGAEIQPFVTFDTRTMPKEEVDRVNDFATPAFFKHVSVASDAAKARGMWIDDTFGTGWPFGGGLAITPELSAIELRFADTVVDGPKAFTGKLSIPEWQPGLIASMMLRSGAVQNWPTGWEERFQARSKVVAVVALRSVPGDGGLRKPDELDGKSAVILTERMQPDGTLDWQIPEGTWHIFVFRQFPTRQPLIGAAGAGPQLVLDHLDKEAFAAHAARVGNPLAAARSGAGSSLRAIFCDSLEVQEYIFWTDGFLNEFRRRRGYDLTPYLAILRQSGYNDLYFSHPGGLPLFDIGDGGDAIRADYWKTVSELIFEGFYHPLDEWAKQHGLLSRVQAHGAPGDLLKLYGDSSIPETEELDGGNTVNFMKLASSAGYDYGRKLVSSESFVFRGNPYVTTPESIKANSDKMFISGINEIVYHGFPYTFDQGPKGIGWFPFQGQFSSQINETNPIWPFIGKVNLYITRVQSIVQRGSNDLQVAIFRSSLNEEDTGPTPANGLVNDPFPALEDALTSAGLSFGFVNEDVLLNATAKHAALFAKSGGKYMALVVPHETNLSPELLKSLKQFSATGVPIVFMGGLPGANVSFKALEQDRERVSIALRELTGDHGVLMTASPAETASQLARVIEPQVSFTSGDTLLFLKKTIGSTRFYLLTNPNGKQTSTTVLFNEHAAPEHWDPWTGDVQQAAFTRNGGNAVLEINLPPFGSELLSFNDVHQDTHTIAPAQWAEIKRQNVGEAGWSIDAVGNSEKGFNQHLHLDFTRLIDWLDVPDLRTFSGKAVYATHLSISAGDINSASRILLDLGEVRDAAQVEVNGVNAGQAVVHPFVVDVRPLLHPGENEIRVTVANSLTNYVSTIDWPKDPMNQMRHFPPVSSGLLGPVILIYEAPKRQD